jgi:hypothetical protein
LIHAWKVWPTIFFTGLSGAIALYARFIKGYNNLWFLGGFFPLAGFALYSYARQPSQEIQNCYNYLLAKRAATCHLESNSKRFNENDFT